MNETMRPGFVEVVPPELTVDHLYDLICIAHETKDISIKNAAMTLVTRALYPERILALEPSEEQAK